MHAIHIYKKFYHVSKGFMTNQNSLKIMGNRQFKSTDKKIIFQHVRRRRIKAKEMQQYIDNLSPKRLSIVRSFTHPGCGFRRAI